MQVIKYTAADRRDEGKAGSRTRTTCDVMREIGGEKESRYQS
jgi:hypothetical protein